MRRAQPRSWMTDSRTIAVVLLIAVLGFNAELMQVVGWSLAAVYVAWRFVVRPVRMGIPIPLARLIAIPLLLLYVGFLGFYRNQESEFLKDCWYFFSPVIYLAFGYYFAERLGGVKQVIVAYCIAGTLVSIAFLGHVYYVRNDLLLSTSVEDYRHQFGNGACQSIIPAVLLCLSRRTGIYLGRLSDSRLLRGLMYLLALAAVGISFSRTLIMVTVCGLLVGLSPSRFLRFGLLAAIPLTLAGFLLSTVTTHLPAVSGAFVDKIMQSGDEVDIRSYDTMQDINDNWRGFEGYRALAAYRSFDSEEKLLGGGDGTPVDIGFAMNLGGPEMLQELPTLHNGYLYLLVKTGVIGILLFAAYLGLVVLDGFRLTRAGSNTERFCGYIYLWSAIVFALTQGVITGIYNKGALAANLTLLGAVSALAVAYSRERGDLYEVHLEGSIEDSPMLPWRPGFPQPRLAPR